MSATNKPKIIKILLLAFICLSILVVGCGLRKPNTGSLLSRLIDSEGNAVVNAQVYSIFAEAESVLSEEDGTFYLSRLPAGINNIVIVHPNFGSEERQIEILPKSVTRIEQIRLDSISAPRPLTAIKVEKVTADTVSISWNSYKPLKCIVDYGKNLAYGHMYRENLELTEHLIVLKNLEPESVYHFRIQFIDNNSVTHYSHDYSFKTEQAEQPPKISFLTVKGLEELKKLTLEWQIPDKTSVFGYNIYRKVKGKDWEKLNSEVIPRSDTSFSDLASDGGRFVRYAICSVNSLGAESEKTQTAYYFVPGLVIEDQTLTKQDSPIIISSDLIIGTSVNFNVQEGVKFLISGTDSAKSGTDEQKVEVIIHGRIVLNGTEQEPIVFAPYDGLSSRDHWQGLKILSSSTGISDLKHVTLSGCKDYAIKVEAQAVKIEGLKVYYSENGIFLTSLRDPLLLDSCLFEDISGVAVKIENSLRVTLKNSLITDSRGGIECLAGTENDLLELSETDIYASDFGIKGVFARSKIKNTLIVTPEATAIEVIDTLRGRANHIDHCTIDAKNGILIRQGDCFIENNIISSLYEGGEIGIKNLTGVIELYPFNNVHGFATSYSGCSFAYDDLSLEPLFVGGNPFSYKLEKESALNFLDVFDSQLGRYGRSAL